MKVVWFGTASILIEDEDVRILFDPYLKLHNPSLPPFPLDDIGDVKAIFITHPHLDHFADMQTVMEHCPAPVFVCARGMEIAQEQGFDMTRMYRIDAGDAMQIGGLTVHAWRSRHCEYDRPVVRETLSRALKPSHLREGLSVDRQNHLFRIDMQRDVLAFEVSSAQRSVFLLGSANCCDDVDYPKHMDLLVYPYQGRSDMETYSMQFLDRFSPRCVMLDHFDDAFPPVSSQMNCAPFLERVRQRCPGMKIFEPRELAVYEV